MKYYFYHTIRIPLKNRNFKERDVSQFEYLGVQPLRNKKSYDEVVELENEILQRESYFDTKRRANKIGIDYFNNGWHQPFVIEANSFEEATQILIKNGHKLNHYYHEIIVE